MFAIEAYTQDQVSQVNKQRIDNSPTSNADQGISAGTGTRLLQTQIKTQDEAYRIMIAQLLRENNLLRNERDSFKHELERKSLKWKRIKEKLFQRQTIRKALGSALYDDIHENSSSVKPENSSLVDLSEDDQTQMHKEDLSSAQDGIEFLAEAADFSVAKENVGVSNAAIGQKRKAAEYHRNDCPCCVKYFQAVGQDSSNMEFHHANSRHNYRQTGPGTPPGFWNVGFTQD